MTRPAIHQIVVGAGIGDAITTMAINVRNALREHGPSEIFAHHLSPDAAHEVLPLRHLGRAGRSDLLIYHASIGEPAVTQLLLARPERLIVVYHNITPSRFFIDYEPHFAASLHWGRHELTLIRDRVVMAVAVSHYNAQDLAEAGFSDVHTVPAGLRPSRLTEIPPCGSLALRLDEAFPNGFALTVSQLLPHKRFETILEAMHLVQYVHERPLGLVFAGTARMSRYLAALQIHARRLRIERMWFFGQATDAELATLYRMAAVYVSASAHEGLALPPLEAMSFGVPVVAREAGALRETIGGAGIVLPSTAGPMMLSEAIAEVDRNTGLQSHLRHIGHERVSHIEAEDSTMKFMLLIEALV